ncbi:DUF5318 family protein [Nonomuraea sp. NPDC047897]|uniref:DUF5318 family protein n=1 Tax=Nonomuraea sp. NPDC047897 TaxID=3364346 RepID=UPI00371A44E5
MWSQRKVVDVALAKIATARGPRVRHADVCDAQLILSGRLPGAVSGASRPSGAPPARLCPRRALANAPDGVNVRGRWSARHAGPAKVASEPVKMVHDYDEHRVCAVEVCQGRSNDHLTVSFVLGNGPPDLAGRV